MLFVRYGREVALYAFFKFTYAPTEARRADAWDPTPYPSLRASGRLGWASSSGKCRSFALVLSQTHRIFHPARAGELSELFDVFDYIRTSLMYVCATPSKPETLNDLLLISMSLCSSRCLTNVVLK